jgi:hypothetical protein
MLGEMPDIDVQAPIINFTDKSGFSFSGVEWVDP